MCRWRKFSHAYEEFRVCCPDCRRSLLGARWPLRAQDADANVGVWPMKTIGQATPTGPVTSLIRFGQAMTMPCRVPPKWEAICLVHLNGVSKAQAQPTAICGVVTGEPQAPSDIV